MRWEKINNMDGSLTIRDQLETKLYNFQHLENC